MYHSHLIQFICLSNAVSKIELTKYLTKENAYICWIFQIKMYNLEITLNHIYPYQSKGKCTWGCMAHVNIKTISAVCHLSCKLWDMHFLLVEIYREAWYETHSMLHSQWSIEGKYATLDRTYTTVVIRVTKRSELTVQLQ